MASPVVLPTTTTTTTLNTQETYIQNQTLPPQEDSPTSNNISHTPTNNNNNNINNNSNNDNNNGSVNKKKRSLDQVNVSEKSPFLKIRAVVSELRPLILEAIKAPYLETCEARPAIEEKVKVIVDQYRQQQTQDPSQKQDGRLSQLLRAHLLSQEEKRLASQNSIAKPAQGKHKIPGSYIIGGSAFGWNFLMFQGTKPEYYGRTKEAFRAGQ